MMQVWRAQRVSPIRYNAIRVTRQTIEEAVDWIEKSAPGASVNGFPKANPPKIRIIDDCSSQTAVEGDYVVVSTYGQVEIITDEESYRWRFR